MLTKSDTPYRQPLEGGLVLRTAAEGDVERVAEFSGAIHGAGVDTLTRGLFLHHPGPRGRDLVFVEEEDSGRVVSMLCLIPWTWRCGEVSIPAGEMGIVGTLEEYRRRGLISAQVAYFKRRLGERGCLLSHIQGIPYYYRQFGYEYALPLEGGLRLELRDVPSAEDSPAETFTFRLATPEDIPALMRWYEEAARDLVIHAVRDEAIWRYLLTDAQGTETAAQFWIVQSEGNEGGRAVGYVALPQQHFGKELAVGEVSRLGFDPALATLRQLKRWAVEREKPGIRLNLPADGVLMRLAHTLGAHDLGTYAWQIHVPDMAALLRALAPVLERRVAESPFAGLSRDVRVSLYREAIRLRFEAGRLTDVANLGFTSGAPIRFPPLQFIPLVLGYRTREELQAVYPDVGVEPAWRLLVDTLFPQAPSFIYTIY